MALKDILKNAAGVIEQGGKTVTEKAKVAGDKIATGSANAIDKTKNAVSTIGKGGKNAVEVTHDAVIKAMDQDGNGIIDSADLIIIALKVPGVRIERDSFLRKEFARHCTEEIINSAVETTPLQAGVDAEIIDKLVDETIKFERNAVSGISMALGMPGGVAMAATIPADVAQYYGYMLRAAQKMMYLYGFPELDVTEDGINLDSETLNSLTVCLGIMYGVAKASTALKAMAKAFATGVEKQLMRKALTKGTIYPIVKSVAKWFGKRMTKEVFAGFFKKAIPVVGGVIGGGLTYATFKPCCNRLKDTLKDTSLSNPNYTETAEEKQMYEQICNGTIIDVEPDELTEVEDETIDLTKTEE